MASIAQVHKVAAVQMVSGPVVSENLDAARVLAAEGARQGAKVVCLPEYFCLFGMRERDKVDARERDGAGPIQRFLSGLARELGVWIVGGTVPLESSDPGKVRNSCLVFDDRGERVARYDKIHLFGFTTENERYQESGTIEAGASTVALDSPFGRLGLSICYDLRFPELYRGLGPVDVLFVPSAFTETTGRAHWEVLLRARAIENLAYVVAAAQGGHHANGRRTHGHTMIIDPWGEVLCRLETGPGVVVAEIDPGHAARLRASLPALDHRVL